MYLKKCKEKIELIKRIRNHIQEIEQTVNSMDKDIIKCFDKYVFVNRDSYFDYENQSKNGKFRWRDAIFFKRRFFFGKIKLYINWCDVFREQAYDGYMSLKDYRLYNKKSDITKFDLESLILLENQLNKIKEEIK